MEEVERICDELRAQGLCKVKENTERLDYTTKEGRTQRILLFCLESYPRNQPHDTIYALQGAILIEKLMVRQRCIEAIEKSHYKPHKPP